LTVYVGLACYRAVALGDENDSLDFLLIRIDYVFQWDIFGEFVSACTFILYVGNKTEH